MTIDHLAHADSLPDEALLARLDALARTEREATAELVAHLAALEARPSAYAARGFGTLFEYCRTVLRLSEDAIYNRLAAADVCRRYPFVLPLLASGEVTLTTLRLLRPHLTADNVDAVLERARRRTRREIEILVAELAPQPDTASSVRRLPTPARQSLLSAPSSPSVPAAPSMPVPALAPRSGDRPTLRPTAPERYRVQFTIDEATHAELEHVRRLLRREIPDGDPGKIFARALALLRRHVDKEKLGIGVRPQPHRRRRSGTADFEPSMSRHIPAAVTAASWARDGGQCAFVARDGRRCTERAFLEFHHRHPFALSGPATPDNISLRCRRHNQYEAEHDFGRRAKGP